MDDEAEVNADASDECTTEADLVFVVDKDIQEEKIERSKRNRERAIELRKSRVAAAHPYSRPQSSSDQVAAHVNKPKPNTAASYRDSHAGFIIEDEPMGHSRRYKIVEDNVPAMPDELMMCSECGKQFAESYLYSKFQLPTCDKCRDPNGKHSLITKTESKQRYLLKDCDFGERNGPPLPFLLKRNPHTSGWGEMKLFLLCQVESRSHDIWGGEEGLEAERMSKVARQEKMKEKKYTKEIKNLRKAVRSTMIKPGSGTHVHSFPSGKEVHNTEDDTWTKTCTECGYSVTFEKM